MANKSQKNIPHPKVASKTVDVLKCRSKPSFIHGNESDERTRVVIIGLTMKRRLPI